jgi:hypothetical protein
MLRAASTCNVDTTSCCAAMVQRATGCDRISCELARARPKKRDDGNLHQCMRFSTGANDVIIISQIQLTCMPKHLNRAVGCGQLCLFHNCLMHKCLVHFPSIVSTHVWSAVYMEVHIFFHTGKDSNYCVTISILKPSQALKRCLHQACLCGDGSEPDTPFVVSLLEKIDCINDAKGFGEPMCQAMCAYLCIVAAPCAVLTLPASVCW